MEHSTVPAEHSITGLGAVSNHHRANAADALDADGRDGLRDVDDEQGLEHLDDDIVLLRSAPAARTA